MSFESKYLKYKNKYLDLKNLIAQKGAGGQFFKAQPRPYTADEIEAEQAASARRIIENEAWLARARREIEEEEAAKRKRQEKARAEREQEKAEQEKAEREQEKARAAIGPAEVPVDNQLLIPSRPYQPPRPPDRLPLGPELEDGGAVMVQPGAAGGFGPPVNTRSYSGPEIKNNLCTDFDNGALQVYIQNELPASVTVYTKPGNQTIDRCFLICSSDSRHTDEICHFSVFKNYERTGTNSRLSSFHFSIFDATNANIKYHCHLGIDRSGKINWKCIDYPHIDKWLNEFNVGEIHNCRVVKIIGRIMIKWCNQRGYF